jgi:hypothetical protein
MTTYTPKPWYREPWPWLLMAGPVIVIIAGCFTAWLAYTRGDPLVTEDYYRKGLAAQQTLASSEKARNLGLQASVRLNAEDLAQVRLESSETGFALPASLRVTLSHPTRAGLDQSQLLQRDGNSNNYRGRLHLPQSGHWLLLIEDETAAWRLLGKVILPAAEVKIGEAAP